MKNSVALDATYHYYHQDWSIVETRNGSDNVLKQQAVNTLARDKRVSSTSMHCEERSPRGCYAGEYRLRLPGD